MLTFPMLDARQTALALPWTALVEEIVRLLHDESVTVPPRLVQSLPGGGSLFVDTADALHEAGDLLQAGLGASRFATLADVVRRAERQDVKKPVRPVLFKSCGWAGWDLAAARAALRNEISASLMPEAWH